MKMLAKKYVLPTLFSYAVQLDLSPIPTNVHGYIPLRLSM